MESGDDMNMTLKTCDKCGAVIKGLKENYFRLTHNNILDVELNLCPACQSFWVDLKNDLLRQKEAVRVETDKRILQALSNVSEDKSQ